MIKRLLLKLECYLGRHRLVTFPVASFTLINHRQVLVTKTICTRCDYCTEI
jgi:hypothetical protein